MTCMILSLNSHGPAHKLRGEYGASIIFFSCILYHVGNCIDRSSNIVDIIDGW